MKVAEALLFLKFFYVSMAAIVISLMIFYVRSLKTRRTISIKPKILFYGWVGFLVAAGILFHFLTALNIPWVHWELKRAHIKPDREIFVTVKDHVFFFRRLLILTKERS